MRIGYTPEQEALEAELRTYFAALMTPALVDELTGGGEGGGPQFRTASQMWVATSASEVQIFWPLITHSSPTRTARVRSEARSVPAFGSL